MPDIPNWAWHEYGNRVGFWRLIEILDSLDIKAALAINGTAVKAYEAISRAALERGWEFMGHGYTQRNMQKVENERDDIAKTTEAIRAFTGNGRAAGSGRPYRNLGDARPAVRRATTMCDWVLDDQPVMLKTRTRPILNVPHTQECNDVAMMLIQHHEAGEYYRRAMDQFEQLHADSRIQRA